VDGELKLDEFRGRQHASDAASFVKTEPIRPEDSDETIKMESDAKHGFISCGNNLIGRDANKRRNRGVFGISSCDGGDLAESPSMRLPSIGMDIRDRMRAA
jgi:hypothetical protein